MRENFQSLKLIYYFCKRTAMVVIEGCNYYILMVRRWYKLFLIFRLVRPLNVKKFLDYFGAFLFTRKPLREAKEVYMDFNILYIMTSW